MLDQVPIHGWSKVDVFSYFRILPSDKVFELPDKHRHHALGSHIYLVSILIKAQSTAQTTCSSKVKACSFQQAIKAGVLNDGIKYQKAS